MLLHGGPGAAGEMAPVARELADAFQVIEPLQRASGEEPLTVDIHVEDLREVVGAYGADAIVGFSWGAMLALAFAAEHPTLVKRLVLIGCGTFDLASRAKLQRNIKERGDRARAPIAFDARGHEETWSNMIHLQQRGVYPQAFQAIRCPVQMIHGADDPHPGRMIFENLRAFMPQLAYQEIARCGHYPWIECEAPEEFYRSLILAVRQNSPCAT